MTTPKPPTGTDLAVARAVREATRNNLPGALTGTQLAAGTASSTKRRHLAGRPDCYVCGKSVEELVEEENVYTRFVVFTARCHGRVQRIRVELEAIVDGRINFGLAFAPDNAIVAPPAPRALPAPGPRETPHEFEEDEEDDLCYACRGTSDDPIHRVRP